MSPIAPRTVTSIGGDAAPVSLTVRTDSLRTYIPTHEAAFQVLRGLDVQVNDFLSDPLLRLAEEMFSRFQARNQQEELQLELVRVAVPAFSATAFRGGRTRLDNTGSGR